ncbi:SapC family protein [soil metagenome]
MSDFTPPYGYDTIIPLRNDHRLLRSDLMPPKIRSVNSVPLLFSEIERAGVDMPVVFAPLGDPAAPSGFMSVAVMGLVDTENVFVDAEGRWESGVYLPAYIRRMPFCTSFIEQDGQSRRLMCVEERVITDDLENSVSIFVDDQPTEAWTRTEQFVLGFEEQIDVTNQAIKVLTDLKLIEGFALNATMPDGSPLTFGGIGRINEVALKALNAAQLRLLFDRGLMRLIYAHLLSIDRFPELLHRRVTRTGSPTEPIPQPQAA